MSGWTTHTTPEGQEYYHNASTGATEWVKPPELAALDAAKAATGWAEHKTPEGQSYYHHAGRGETIWTVPDEWAALDANPPPAAGAEPATAAAPQQAEDAYAAADAGYDEAAGGGGGGEEYVDDPANWEETWDEANAAYFYYNHVTGEQSWERPAILDQAGGGEAGGGGDYGEGYEYSTPVKPRGRELPASPWSEPRRAVDELYGRRFVTFTNEHTGEVSKTFQERQHDWHRDWVQRDAKYCKGYGMHMNLPDGDEASQLLQPPLLFRIERIAQLCPDSHILALLCSAIS